MSKVTAPVGVVSRTATSRTRAAGAPCRSQTTMSFTASGSPSTWATRLPSGSLRTQPLTPIRSASCWASHRNATPWTRPEARTWTAVVLMAPSWFIGADGPVRETGAWPGMCRLQEIAATVSPPPETAALQDAAGRVRRRVGVGGHDLLHTSDDGLGLGDGRPGELDGGGHQGPEVRFGELEPRVGGE